MIKRALISVYDKTGIVALARELKDLGVEVISTGGTMKALLEAGIPVTGVSQVTGFPECLDGRVKTLDPRIHAGILAMRDKPEHMSKLLELGIGTIDLVVINLYPFRKTVEKEGVTLEEAIENIDIGGPAMLRAAAKNCQDVTVMVDTSDYILIMQEIRETGNVSRETKLSLAWKVFEHTGHYDALIARYLRNLLGKTGHSTLTLPLEKIQDLRYGENPHQQASFYRESGIHPGCLTEAEQIHGKELSYNNINDANGALELIKEFADRPTVAAIKHANPCGVGTAVTVLEAFRKAYEADPVSIFGGILVSNTEIDLAAAREMKPVFLEIILAPSYSSEALEELKKKANLRILRLPGLMLPIPAGSFDCKRITGGLLVQGYDRELAGDGQLKTVTRRKPAEHQVEELLFAMKVCKHTKSNAIVLVRDGMTVGIGPGQVSRISALEIAIRQAGEKAMGSVMASDAFFPFPDCVELAAKSGISAIIQPGGSRNDTESIEACDRRGITMLFTGIRHFRH